MGENEIVKEYSTEELTVVWKPKLCIHAEVCVKTLPNVYDPHAKPWISPENADTASLKSQIDKCPSGALSYYMDNDKKKIDMSDTKTKVEVAANGPLLVHGELEVKNPDGEITTKKRTTAFCRCGASTNKPYCDGSHNEIGFKG
ncbi:MAG: (4Fe-4S)-binding protein [Eudoraea sp.]|nr:(4Fe-4S)-binding protein [Eudoraea sp.]